MGALKIDVGIPAEIMFFIVSQMACGIFNGDSGETPTTPIGVLASDSLPPAKARNSSTTYLASPGLEIPGP
jgi:hypothetical protein